MDDEEAENLLRGLRSGLGEFGGAAATQPRRMLPKDGEFDVRSELSRVLDEYEALLVGAPDMLRETMRLLNARRITFETDMSDIRFEGRSSATAADAGPSSSFGPEEISEWLRIGAEAKVVTSELRGRLDDQSR